jgi:hypothetical protein
MSTQASSLKKYFVNMLFHNTRWQSRTSVVAVMLYAMNSVSVQSAAVRQPPGLLIQDDNMQAAQPPCAGGKPTRMASEHRNFWYL